ncbi:diguanylate cyclase response regulator [Marinomonas sp. CT5]|uniref:response regulator n=1 Tax=Marinomonas sp. CT5 TaxID=2066133 RepID=UPI001BB0636A|nr:response regulator [Marinomonas sp. CT5]QUX95632.1 diguanylate cyclase response regulator [Marinomonas sp. CT5]
MNVVRKILVVEDSPVVLKVLDHLLSQNSTFTPVLCATYQEAEDQLEGGNEAFFAAIVDLNLPDAENGEIVDLVLSNKIPCVVLTANFDDDLRLKLLHKGVLDYIAKDSRYSFNHVIKVIERLRKNQGINVLVAEDSSTSRLFIRVLLEQYCFNVIEVENGQEALAMLEKDSTISMLITDFNMPLVNGYDLVRMLRHNSRFQDLVIIGLSAEGDNSLSAKFIKAGANDFLKKPFYHEEFHCRVIHSLEAQEMLEAIRDLSCIDPLTKLKNRRYLFEEGEKIFLSSNKDISLVMLDLDRFKEINDTYGHLVGDSLLTLVSQEMQTAFYDELVCRFSGKKFCILSESGLNLKSKVEHFLADIKLKEFTEAKISISFSASLYSQSTEHFEDLVRKAGQLLRQAKQTGHDVFVF